MQRSQKSLNKFSTRAVKTALLLIGVSVALVLLACCHPVLCKPAHPVPDGLKGSLCNACRTEGNLCNEGMVCAQGKMCIKEERSRQKVHVDGQEVVFIGLPYHDCSKVSIAGVYETSCAGVQGCETKNCAIIPLTQSREGNRDVWKGLPPTCAFTGCTGNYPANDERTRGKWIGGECEIELSCVTTCQK